MLFIHSVRCADGDTRVLVWKWTSHPRVRLPIREAVSAEWSHSSLRGVGQAACNHSITGQRSILVRHLAIEASHLIWLCEWTSEEVVEITFNHVMSYCGYLKTRVSLFCIFFKVFATIYFKKQAKKTSDPLGSSRTWIPKQQLVQKRPCCVCAGLWGQRVEGKWKLACSYNQQM